MKIFDAGLWTLAIVLSLLGVIVAIDLSMAIEAQGCSQTDAGSDCYPWGVEGPAADYWQYKSKEIYLLSGAIAVLLPWSALLGLLITRSARSNLVRAVVGLSLVVVVIMPWL